MSESHAAATPFHVESSADGPVAHRLEVEVEVEHVRRAFDHAYRDLARHARVRGFRPGKAPRSVLERLYGGSLAEQIERDLVADTLPRALEESGIDPVADPTVDAQPPSADAPFRYTARIEVKPRIELPDTSGLAARKPRVEVSDEDVDRELEALRLRHAPELEEPEGTPISEGHLVTVDFVGRIDGKPFPGGSGRGVEMEVGSGRFLPDFESQLVGAVAGEDRAIEVRFPEDYGNERLAGQVAEFAVHVADVKRRHLQEIDDEYAKDMGFEDLAALRQRVRDDLLAARERAARGELRRSLMDSLIERAPFEVPPGMVERALERQLAAAHHRLEGSVSEDAVHAQLARWREEWRPAAEREVRETLLIDAVARREEIGAEEPEVALRIERMAEEQGVDAARLRRAYAGVDLERAVAARVVDEKVLDFLAREAKVEEVTDS